VLVSIWRCKTQMWRSSVWNLQRALSFQVNNLMFNFKIKIPFIALGNRH
jgi:hypothetical protein